MVNIGSSGGLVGNRNEHSRSMTSSNTDCLLMETPYFPIRSSVHERSFSVALH